MRLRIYQHFYPRKRGELHRCHLFGCGEAVPESTLATAPHFTLVAFAARLSVSVFCVLSSLGPGAF